MSGSLKAGLRRILYRYGWDTRSRHRAAVRLLRDAMTAAPPDAQPALLDVGCGRAGLAAFLDSVEVMGVDLVAPQEPLPNRAFTRASVTELPFADDSFPHVACIDVLQDLPPHARQSAISELLRVARDSVVIAAPQGEVAERVDADFERALRSRGAAVPAWVATSLANPYPTVDAVTAAIRLADPKADISVSYAEPVRISKLVRSAAVRSRMLYAAVNLIWGLAASAIPVPAATSAYRMLVVARPGHRASASR